jgi:predicted phosphodiesterase
MTRENDFLRGRQYCALRRDAVRQGLTAFLQHLGTVDELILNGDILDADVASLTEAIEGGHGGQTIGLRRWLDEILHAPDRFRVERIIYIPGNHDYKIWDLLSTERAFMQPLAGTAPRPDESPLTSYCFDDPFLKGVAPPAYRDKFQVCYPNHTFALNGRAVLVTHGHYLDKKQTGYQDITDHLKKTHGNREEAKRRLFINTALYENLANLGSYVKSTRKATDFIADVGTWMDWINAKGDLRDCPIDAKQLSAIEKYLTCYLGLVTLPDVFVFGHTHVPGHSKLSDFGRTLAKPVLDVCGKSPKKRLFEKDIEVWNDGSFVEYPNKDLAGTFLLADDGDAKPIRRYDVGMAGQVTDVTL